MQAIQDYLQQHGFERLRLKAVLFDMDGVLFDSMPNHAASWHQAAEEWGLELPYDEVFLHEGRTGASTIAMLSQRSWHRLATADEEQAIYDTKSRIFNALPTAQRMPGAAQLLQTIRRLGYQIVLVTGSGQRSLLQRLQENFPGIFAADTMVTSFDVKRGKPDPEPYLQGLAKAGVQPWEALVVENAPLGVQAARAARIFTVAVNTGPLDDKVLWDAGANLLYPSVQALADDWAARM